MNTLQQAEDPEYLGQRLVVPAKLDGIADEEGPGLPPHYFYP